MAQMLEELGGFPMPETFPQLDDRDFAFYILGSSDYDAQLRAIRVLLSLHARADTDLSNEIKEIAAFASRASGSANEQATDEWIDHLHHSVFQGAAHSMAAVGMLAPLVESIFKHAFPGIRDLLEPNGQTPANHARWTMPKATQWDCRYASPKRQNLVDGIMELAEAIGLASDLPADLGKTLSALFGYRNKMFHLGFEWPAKELSAFEIRIATDGWPKEWFAKSLSDHKPWIFYLSDTFVQHCLATIDGIFDGLGAFVRRRE